MLYIIGLGLDKEDISLKAINSIKKCRRVFMEYYTSDLPYSFKDIEIFLYKETKGKLKKIDVVDRKFVEENNMMFEEAKRHDVALLVPGDPLSATTHSELIARAAKFNVKCKVIHAPSIITAVAETGLQLYKFGKTTSIPKWQKSYKPESFYNIIQDNRRINAHTLLLIDIGLSVKDALLELKEASEKNLSYNHKIQKDFGIQKTKGFLEETRSQLEKEKIIVCSNIGTEKAVVKSGNFNSLLKQNFNLPACIIIPAPLHFFEEEMLKKFKRKK